MRTIKQLPAGIPFDTDEAKFPDGTIKNETDAAEGTPVVREIYGDVLTNIYKLLRLAKINPSGQEDSEISGYQLVQALQKFSNSMNDIEQQLNLNGLVFSVNLDLSILPNKYICFARSVENYTAGNVYTFEGTDGLSYPFIAVNQFNTGDLILLVIDNTGVRAYNILGNSGESSTNNVFPAFGDPLAFNDSSKLYYQSEGILFSDKPELFDLQGAIRFTEADGTVIVYEMLLILGYVYCLTFRPATLTYKMYRFSVADFNTPILVNLIGTTFPVGVIANNYKPNVYTDGNNVYISNNSGNTANDYGFDIYSIEPDTGNLIHAASLDIDHSFQKTTNAVVSNSNIYTFVGGTITRYNLNTGVKTVINSFPTFIGLIFQLNSFIYYCNGEVAKQWLL